MSDMRRREFIALLGGAALAWLLAARAQQSAMPVVGFLRSTTADGFEHLIAAFREGLNATGYVEGRNVAIEFRWADNFPDRLARLVTELISRQVAIIVAGGSPAAALAAKAATGTTPILFVTGGDPMSHGLVTSFNAPGGNVTGVSLFNVDLVAKQVELLSELTPKATLLFVLITPRTRTSKRRSDRRKSPRVLWGFNFTFCELPPKMTSTRLLGRLFNREPARYWSALMHSSRIAANSSSRWRHIIVCLRSTIGASSSRLEAS
jgi:ABC-type uncharacterized transport system substrate-binding protein